MVTQKQLRANQENSKKSTGPKTCLGKMIVSKNAVKHGIFSTVTPVNEEEWLDYQEFSKEMNACFKPTNLFQRCLVDRVISTAWRLRRILDIETLILQSSQENSLSNTISSAFQGDSSPEMAVLSRYERSLENTFFRTLKEYWELKERDSWKTLDFPF